MKAAVFMTQLKDQAVCIRQQSYSETSQILTFFSQCHGKIRAIAKGARREKGKYGGGVDLLSGGVIIFIPAQGESGLGVLVEFELENPYAYLRRHLIAQNCALYGAGLLAEFTEDLDPHERLFHAFEKLLTDLETTRRPENELVRFELALLREVGLAPSWTGCIKCGCLWGSQKGMYFKMDRGGLVCKKCAAGDTLRFPVKSETAAVFQNSEQLDRHQPVDVLCAHELLSSYEVRLLGKQPAIMKFLNQLLKNEISNQRK